jgi:hypothetical protein
MVYYKVKYKNFPQVMTEITENLTKEKRVPGRIT